jgi:hypothetical protein
MAVIFPVERKVLIIQCLMEVSNSRNITSLLSVRNSPTTTGSVGLDRELICSLSSRKSAPEDKNLIKHHLL